jgi:DNA-binding NarL/FixJ family response regulator
MSSGLREQWRQYQHCQAGLIQSRHACCHGGTARVLEYFPEHWSSVGNTKVFMQVLIADDHQLVREGFKLLIHQFGSATQFLEARDYASLDAQLEANPDVDVVIADLHMPGTSHSSNLELTTLAHPSIPFVVVSAFSSPDVVRKVLALPSVYAFVPKNGSPGNMHLAIQAALVRHKIGELNDAAVMQAPIKENLPPRLEAVRTLLREGKSNKAIAHALGLSEGTVKNYMSDIFKSLKVTNRTQAARNDDQFPI